MGNRRQPLATPIDLKPLVARAVDADLMLAVFERELPPLASTPLRITSCKARAGKARSALKKKRLRVKYAVTAHSPQGKEWRYNLLATLPVTPEFLSPELLACCQAAHGHPAVEPFQRLAAFLPELEMGVQFLPVDTALPAMIQATRPDGGRLVVPFVAECRNGTTLAHTDTELLHYKPGSRCVLRFTLKLADHSGDVHERVVFGKIFADDRGAMIHGDMQTLWEVACRSECLRVPEPLGYAPDHRMLVMTEAPGRRDLNYWVKCLEKQLPLPPSVTFARVERSMVVVAQALSELHQSGIHPRTSRTFEHELADECKDLELTRQGHPELAREIERVLRQLKAHAPRNERLVPCHGGFRHKQLMGDDRYLTVLDWDGLTWAHPALDAASFVCRLRHKPITESGRVQELERLAGVFRREFLARQPAASPHDLALYEALVLADVALRALRRPKRDAEVVAHVHRLLAEAERLLNGQRAEAIPP